GGGIRYARPVTISHPLCNCDIFPSLLPPASLGFYFTSLQNVYYYDLGGTVYSIDDQLNLSRADDVYPNPAPPDSTFIVGLICHYLDAGFRLRSLRDDRDNPWFPKATYSDVYAAKASLQGANDLAGLFSWDALDLSAIVADLAADNLDLNSFEGLNGVIGKSGERDEDNYIDTEYSDPASLAPAAFGTTPGNEPSASDLALEPRVDFGSFSTLDLVNDQVDRQNHSAAYENPIASASSHAVTFGSKDDIDTWVDSLKTQRKRKSTPRPELRCPLEGCGTIIRRPQALKEHLYSHYNRMGVHVPGVQKRLR
ncbi:hypothetical protein FRC08_013019, partial [Ceratobasidium sp. 394]